MCVYMGGGVILSGKGGSLGGSQEVHRGVHEGGGGFTGGGGNNVNPVNPLGYRPMMVGGGESKMSKVPFYF